MEKQPTVELLITANADKAIENVNKLRAAFQNATHALQQLKQAYADLPWLVRCALRLQALWDFRKG